MENLPDLQAAMPKPRELKSIWALVIGIDKYEDTELTNLNGAVQDAKAISDFLTSQHVPAEQIRMLTDEDATYTGIVKAFDEHLIMNPDVHHGDPLLFYFAGHGSRYSRMVEKRWKYWEAICPSDRNTAATLGAKVPDIVKDTLECLLATLAVVKGENITVILDCCHQPNTRVDAKESLLRVRYAPPIQDAETTRAMFVYPEDQGPLHTQGLLPSTTCSPITRQGVGMAAKVLNNDTKLATRVLLAASQTIGLAYEKASKDIPGCSGLFTSALLLVLKEALEKNVLAKLTYRGLIAEISNKLAEPKVGLPMQRPRCEGKNESRPLFAIHTARRTHDLVPATLTGGQGGVQLRVEVGAIHGACQTTEFDVWSDTAATKYCGKLVTEKVFSTYSLVKPKPGFEQKNGRTWYAGVSWWGNTVELRVPIHVAFNVDTAQDERQVLAECMQLMRNGQSRDGIEIVAELVEPAAELEEPNAGLEEPDAEVEGPPSVVEDAAAPLLEESATVLHVETPALQKPAFPLISDVRDGVMTVKRSDPITGAANIEFFCPTAREALKLLNRMLRFEMHLARKNPQNPLLGTLEFGFVRKGEPMKNNLFDKQHRALLPNNEAEHQFIVVNNGNKPLWVFVYYFDPMTYTVDEFYAPKLGMGPPLKANDKLVIGTGERANVRPFSFIMAEGLQNDSGFAKIFVSETYTDFRMLEEQNGFIYVNPYPDPPTSRGGTALSEDGIWDSIVTTITVSR